VFWGNIRFLAHNPGVAQTAKKKKAKQLKGFLQHLKKPYFSQKSTCMKNLLGWFLIPAVLFYLYMAAFVMGPGSEQLKKFGGQDITMPDLHLFTSEAHLQFAFLEAIGQEGRDFYMYFSATADTLYPISYTLVIFLALLYMLRKTEKKKLWHLLLLLPILSLMTDLLENQALIGLTAHFPESKPGLFVTYQICWVLKFASLIAAVIGIFGLAFFWLKKLYAIGPKAN
jgi:uncharacterized membrane protein